MSQQGSRLNRIQEGASTSRISLDSTLHQFSSTATQDHRESGLQRPESTQDKYDISNLLTDPSSSSAFLPSLPSLSQNTYLPSQLTSLGTTFTSSGTLPRSSTPGGKSVAQRRSQAPPLVQTELRKVGKDEFQGYLNEVGEEYDNWVRESKAMREELEHEDQEGEGGEENVVDQPAGSPQKELTKSKRKKRKDREESESLPPLNQVPSIFFDPAFNLSNPRTFDLVTERIQLTPSSSPSLTFSPRLASSIHDSSDELVIPGLGPTTLNDLASDQLLQEKLSHFTAVIESHLVREIGLRSSSFFSALSNLQDLHQQGSSALSKIEELKAKLVDKEGGVNGTARHGLQILRLQARRRGLERIEESVRAVEEVASALEGVKELVENGEWVGALEVAESIQEAYERSALPQTSSSTTSTSSISANSSSPTTTTRATNTALNLTKLTALKSLSLKLSLIRAQIAKSLEGELISVLEHEMDLGIETGIKRGRRKAEGEMGESDSIEEELIEGSERMKERTRPVVKALVRSEGMDSAIQAWRESVLREIRAMVREHLPTSEDGAGGDQEEEDPFASAAIRSVSKQSIDLGTISDKSLSLAKKLRAMSHEAFLRLAQETYLGLLACIETVDLQSQILLELVSQSREEENARKAKRRMANGLEVPNPPNLSSSLSVPGTDSSITTSSSVFSPVSSPILNGNSEDSSSSLSTEITEVLTAVTELSNVRFSKVIGVRSEVHAQLPLEQFLEIFDQTWSFVLRCEVLVKRMIVGLRGAMVSQSKGWLMSFHQKRINENAKLVEEEQWSASEVPLKVQKKVELIVKGAMVDPEELLLGQRRKEPAKERIDEGEERAAVAKQVEIEGRQFFAVSAGLATIETLVEYLRVVLNCPMLTTDAMSKVVEFMKVFNSRACQVVLGAGAMRSAGLKNITAKNLALASQALSIMVSLIPYIRELIRRHLNPKQAVMLTEFDKLKRDYQEHQNEIHFKLVAIMSDRLIVHSRTLETINWEEPTPKPGQPNAYMESLVKEHLTLYKVLSRFLHSETVFAIMSQVFKALDSKLGQEYDRIEFKSEEAKERVLVDVKFLQDKLGGLKGLEEENGPGKAIETLVLAKSLPPRTTKPTPAPAPGPSSSEQSSTAALRPPKAAVETPLPSTPSLWTSLPPSASNSALSLALPEAPSTPRTSLDAPAYSSSPPISQHHPHPHPPRNRSPSPGPQPPSPVPVPAPLPPSPTPVGPGQGRGVGGGSGNLKKKSLAERLAERIGRKPVEAVPPQQLTSPRSSLDESQQQQQPPNRLQVITPDISLPVREREQGQLEHQEKRDEMVTTEKNEKEEEDEKLLQQVEKEIPVWTPQGEKELEQVEKLVEQEVKAENGLGISSSAVEEETTKVDERVDLGQKEEDGTAVSTTPNNQVENLESRDGEEQTGNHELTSKEEGEEESVFEPRPESTSVESSMPEANVDAEDKLKSQDPPRIESEGNQQSLESPTQTPRIAAKPPTSSEAEVQESIDDAAKEEEVAAESTLITEDSPDDTPSTVENETPSSDRVPSNEMTETTTPSVQTIDQSTTEGSKPPPSSASSPISISIPSHPLASPPISSSSTSPVVRSPTSPPPPDPTVAGTTAPSSSTTTATAEPPRKKTLKERLAEAARRGSTGNSLVNVVAVTSPPPPPARPSLELASRREEEAEAVSVAETSPSKTTTGTNGTTF